MNDNPPKFEEEKHVFAKGRLGLGLLFALTSWGPFIASLFPVFGLYDSTDSLIGYASLTDLLSVYIWPLFLLIFLIAAGMFSTAGAFLSAFGFDRVGMGLLVGGFVLESLMVYSLTTHGASAVSELTFPLLWVLSAGTLFLFFRFGK
jgi:hypothetical protein